MQQPFPEWAETDMRIVLRKASVEDALLISTTRRTVWEQTYRGIYPDHKIDQYDYTYYIGRDTALLSDPEHHYYLFFDEDRCIGYFSYGPYNYGTYKDFILCLNNLYVLDGYKGRGLGKQAFSCLRAYAREQRIERFFCGCNAHNVNAQEFYRYMGGIPGEISTGHADKSDDIIHFEFYTGD